MQNKANSVPNVVIDVAVSLITQQMVSDAKPNALVGLEYLGVVERYKTAKVLAGCEEPIADQRSSVLLRQLRSALTLESDGMAGHLLMIDIPPTLTDDEWQKKYAGAFDHTLGRKLNEAPEDSVKDGLSRTVK